MKDTNVIQEDFCLPSKGKIYSKQFDPHVKLRSMTVAEEMKRLAYSEFPYKAMSEIIQDCLLTELPINVYDLCLGDYVYLLHKLRVVTYGTDYSISYVCPFCKESKKQIVDLNELTVFEYDESVNELMRITLPKTGKVVELRFQTPRDIDWIDQKSKEMKKKFPDMKGDPKIIYTLATFIDTIDGEHLDPVLGFDGLKNLPSMDMIAITQAATKLNEKVGIDTAVTLHCDTCGNDVTSAFRYTSEFFGPTIY